MHINNLEPGQCALVTEIRLDPADEQRLREHGLDEGIEVELLHRAALGADPVAVRIGNACVAMRRRMAEGVLVTPVELALAAE